MKLTAFDTAMRFAGNVKEIAGSGSDPAIVWFLQSCDRKATSDEIPWCSGFVNRVAWLHRLPRSQSLAARSWLLIGNPVALSEARRGWDIVILKRGSGQQPGPEVTSGAPGHVGFFAGMEEGGLRVMVLGGNQGNEVSVAAFKASDVLGVRRLFEEL